MQHGGKLIFLCMWRKWCWIKNSALLQKEVARTVISTHEVLEKWKEKTIPVSEAGEAEGKYESRYSIHLEEEWLWSHSFSHAESSSSLRQAFRFNWHSDRVRCVSEWLLELFTTILLKKKHQQTKRYGNGMWWRNMKTSRTEMVGVKWFQHMSAFDSLDLLPNVILRIFLLLLLNMHCCYTTLTKSVM